MSDNPKRLLDNRIAELQGEIEAIQAKIANLRTLREAFDDESVAEELEQIFRAAAEETADSQPSRDGGLQLQEVRRFFVRRRNQWATPGEVQEATGVKDSTIRQMVYSRFPEQFERREHPTVARRVQLRLVTANSEANGDQSA